MYIITALTLLALATVLEKYVKTYRPEVWEELNRFEED